MSDCQQGNVCLSFPSETKYIHMVTMLANHAATMAGFSKQTAGKIAIATDEAVTNIIKHAYEGKSDKVIRLQVNINPDTLVLDVIHSGKPLTNDDIRLPVMEEYIKNRRVGGLGLFLITKFVDEVDYLVGDEHRCKMTLYRKNKDKKQAATKKTS